MNKKDSQIVLIVLVVILAGALASITLVRKSTETNNPISTEEKVMIQASIRKQFGINWSSVKDGCGENSLIGMTKIIRTSTGYKADINYLCGLIVQETPPSHAIVYISSNGQVTGVPAPN